MIFITKGEHIPSYQCLSTHNVTCVFSNIHLNSTLYDWKPEATDPLTIEKIEFIECSIPVVTKAICETFPSLKKFYIRKCNVEFIKEDAFDSCDQLQVLYLQYNNLVRLDKGTFKNLYNLKVLHLQWNQIKELDPLIFSHLYNLEEISLGRNNLTEFPARLVRFNPRIKAIWLHSNDISDLDVEQIIEFLSNLQKFEIDENEISCKRLYEILNIFEFRGIEIGHNFHYKKRFYKQYDVNGFKCKPVDTWLSANCMRKDPKLIWSLEEVQRSQKHSEMVCYYNSHILNATRNEIMNIDYTLSGLRGDAVEFGEKLDDMSENISHIVQDVSMSMTNTENFLIRLEKASVLEELSLKQILEFTTKQDTRFDELTHMTKETNYQMQHVIDEVTKIGQNSKRLDKTLEDVDQKFVDIERSILKYSSRIDEMEEQFYGRLNKVDKALSRLIYLVEQLINEDYYSLKNASV